MSFKRRARRRALNCPVCMGRGGKLPTVESVANVKMRKCLEVLYSDATEHWSEVPLRVAAWAIAGANHICALHEPLAYEAGSDLAEALRFLEERQIFRLEKHAPSLLADAEDVEPLLPHEECLMCCAMAAEPEVPTDAKASDVMSELFASERRFWLCDEHTKQFQMVLDGAGENLRARGADASVIESQKRTMMEQIQQSIRFRTPTKARA